MPHTPGEWKKGEPWADHYGEMFIPIWVGLDLPFPHGKTIALVSDTQDTGWDDDGNPPAEMQANADLITAAPALLEALIEIRDKRHSQSFTVEQAAEIARAAIAKAEDGER